MKFTESSIASKVEANNQLKLNKLEDMEPAKVAIAIEAFEILMERQKDTEATILHMDATL